MQSYKFLYSLAVIAAGILLSNCATTSSIFKNKNTDFTKDAVMLRVTIQNGKIKLLPSTQFDYNPVTFSIENETCKKISMSYLNQSTKVPLQACYQNDSLYLDPSRFGIHNTQGAIHFSYNPLWNQGFTYNHVDSYGRIGLTGADVTIKTINN